ncbi:unnamed protein product [Protopolystoma xenopodis]|uniref:Uncharacterized protein n=1 Tax=Protopolystoma xenopodis TaxID=117903 RepID=A0A448WF43_9PLAT|nr:unnamed protein product [Protopolystoma xenopodis]
MAVSGQLVPASSLILRFAAFLNETKLLSFRLDRSTLGPLPFRLSPCQLVSQPNIRTAGQFGKTFFSLVYGASRSD